MGTRVRSSIVLLAFVVCVCSASARVIGAQAPGRQPSVTTDVMYGQKEDGLALTLDVHRPAHPNGAGLICVVSGGWQSSVALARIFTQAMRRPNCLDESTEPMAITSIFTCGFPAR